MTGMWALDQHIAPRVSVGLVSAVFVVVSAPGTISAEERFVGGPGDPYQTIGEALADAQDGDVITVRAGTYEESLESRAEGVTLRAEAGGEVVITHDGRVLRLRHARFSLEGVVIDGQYGDRDAVIIDDAADHATLRRVEVRRSGRDCIDIRGPAGVRIEESLIHHCLWSSVAECDEPGCRQDAHGIVAGPVRDLVIADTEIHTFSGDAFQVDPGRSASGWSDVTIERCRFWLEPLPAAEGGFAAGIVPGENAIDTKTSDDIETPARLVVRDVVAHGFRDGLISNMAAFNMKENVEVIFDRVTVHDSEIAFRLRGATATRPRGAQVIIQNTVIYDVAKAVRYEDDILPVSLFHVTLGGGIDRVFDDQSSGGSIIGRNIALLGDTLPAELSDTASNLALASDAFVAASAHDYHLAAGSPAIDAGEAIEGIDADRDGVPRPQGAGPDVGAYELCEDACEAPHPPVDAGVGSGGDGGAVGRDAAAGGGASEAGGCGCRVGQPSPSGAAWLLVFAAIALRRRTRRKQQRSMLKGPRHRGSKLPKLRYLSGKLTERLV
jgi:MYXO-CTERM domain-containing protein